MAIALVANTGIGSANGSTITTAAINTTGANLIVVGIAENKNVAHGTLTDSNGNTWTGLTTIEDSSRRVKQYYCASPTVGSGHTFTYTLSGSTFPSVMVTAWSGAHATPFDAQSVGATQATGATIQPGTLTPSVNGCLVISTLFRSTDAGTCTIDAGFTISDLVPFASGQCLAGGMAYLIQSTAAASNPTWSGIDAGVGSATVQASFKAATSGITLGAKGSGINSTAATSVTATITGTPVQGSTWIVGLTSRSSTQTITGFTDDSSGGPMEFFQIGSWVNGATNSRTSLWRTAVGGGKSGATVITAAMTPTEQDAIICATEWLNVSAIGGDNSASGTTANPTIALTTQDANNFVVAMFGSRGGTVPTSLTGTLQLGLASNGGSQMGGGMVSNTVASAGSVTCAETLAAATWMALVVELRTSAGGGGGSSGKIAAALMRRRGL